ncbi:DUF192 domain-containing protein [Halostella sp. JP-L12]|uniref:DUF192 domain-containing protein n=1 Tax=Halostella TaxID=1843185 RepID=UPI000EF79101|nr:MULTISPECIES: DUF192 domain-containing protein [Halostella]NHN48282.1 DUF192 domain-containing protein [Halostella sp. JP-L12]
MERWKVLNVAGVFVVLALVGGAAVQAGLVANPFVDDRDRATVTVTDGDGGNGTLAVVEAEVADTNQERYTGLSDHESLENGSGMLFVHDDENDRTYVMREMDFGIDIVFVAANRTITTIHEAPKPGPNEDGEQQRYGGVAKWVLEVPKGYTDAQGIEEGDRIEIEYGNGTANASENATVRINESERRFVNGWSP